MSIEQPKLAGKVDQLKAALDRWWSKTFQTEKWGGINEGLPSTVHHMRGGKRIGVKNPYGRIDEIMNANTIVHEYDALGRLIERRVIKGPSHGRTVATDEELAAFDEEDRRLFNMGRHF